MAICREVDQEKLQEWAETRPPLIRDLIARFPPNRLYLLKSSGNRVTIYSYSEGGTMSVFVTEEFNAFLFFNRIVFGVPPEDLEECDLP